MLLMVVFSAANREKPPMLVPDEVACSQSHRHYDVSVQEPVLVRGATFDSRGHIWVRQVKLESRGGEGDHHGPCGRACGCTAHPIPVSRSTTALRHQLSAPPTAPR